MVTKEQAEGLAKGLINGEFVFSAIFESFTNPKKRKMTEEILSYWEDSKYLQIKRLMLGLKRAYLESCMRKEMINE